MVFLRFPINLLGSECSILLLRWQWVHHQAKNGLAGEHRASIPVFRVRTPTNPRSSPSSDPNNPRRPPIDSPQNTHLGYGKALLPRRVNAVVLSGYVVSCFDLTDGPSVLGDGTPRFEARACITLSQRARFVNSTPL